MKVSKELAGLVANKMTDKKRKEIEVIEKQISEIGYDLAKSTVPKKVLEFYNDNHGYFYKCSQIQVSGNGMNYQVINFSPSVPTKNEWRINKSVDEKTGKKLSSLFSEKEAKQKELKELKNEIESAILSLGTHARVEEKFNEAYKLFPVKKHTEVIVNIDSIRKKL